MSDPAAADMMGMPVEMMQPEQNGAVPIIRREVGEVAPSRKALVADWEEKVQAGKKRWDEDFKRMEADMAFAEGLQWPEQKPDEDRYRANITLRQINQKVASLYARNPTIKCRRKKRLEFTAWDGDLASLQQAIQNVLNPATAPVAQAIVDDAQAGRERKKLLDRMAQTLELVFEGEIGEQSHPGFKREMKAMARRSITCGVGYLKLGYYAEREQRPEDAQQVRDITQQLARLETLIDDRLHKAENCAEESAKAETLKLALQHAQELMEKGVLKEGLVFNFPRSMAIIPDPACTSLEGFTGAHWVAEEFKLSVEAIKDIYGIDVSEGKAYEDPKLPSQPVAEQGQGQEKPPLRAVYQIYDRDSGLVFELCEGYADFLVEPAPPKAPLQQFWPWFALMLNGVESTRTIFPPSDVQLIRPMQCEHNRSREALREHRVAKRPHYAAAAGKLTETDKANLGAMPAHGVTELQGLAPGEKVGDVLQEIQHAAIDPAVYDTSQVQQDLLMVVGSQEANFGPTTGATATESAIAEGSRVSSVNSNVDDVDDLLNAVVRACGQLLLLNMQEETVKRAAGPGAVWSTLSPREVSEELYLEILAGSSGRPNKALEMQNMKDLVQWLLQLPGMRPESLMREVLRRWDERLELDDFYDPNLPSISAQNRPAPALPGAGSAVEAGPASPHTPGGAEGAMMSPPESSGEMAPAVPGSMQGILQTAAI